jgi:hypothetical protein
MQIEEKNEFDFEEFKNKAIADMKAGKSLVGKDGIFTPLMKEFLRILPPLNPLNLSCKP